MQDQRASSIPGPKSPPAMIRRSSARAEPSRPPPRIERPRPAETRSASLIPNVPRAKKKANSMCPIHHSTTKSGKNKKENCKKAWRSKSKSRPMKKEILKGVKSFFRISLFVLQRPKAGLVTSCALPLYEGATLGRGEPLPLCGKGERHSG